MIESEHARVLLEEAIAVVRGELKEVREECPRLEALRGLLGALERRRGRVLSERDLGAVLRLRRRAPDASQPS